MLASFIKRNPLIIYYAIMMGVMLSWSSTTVAPPLFLRILFLGLLFLPLIGRRFNYFPFVLTVFLSVASYGFAYSFMPTEVFIYAVLTITFVLFHSNRLHYKRIKGYQVVLFLTIYVFLIDLFNGSTYHNTHYFWLMLSLMPLLLYDNRDENSLLLSYSFILFSLIISILYVTHMNEFVQEYIGASVEDRSGWMDYNYFSSAVGIGLVLSVERLMYQKKRSQIETVLLSATIALSFLTIALNASRGAMLATLASLAVLLLSSRLKVVYKLLFLFLGVGLVLFFLSKGYLDLLIMRTTMTQDTTGSGRTEIWGSKLSDFINNGNPLWWIFGVGYDKGLALGFPNPIGFHNNFLSYLMEYGLVGLIALLILMIRPLLLTPRKNRAIMISLVVYIIIVCMTLEPISLGSWLFFSFFLLLYCKMDAFQRNAS